METIYSQGAEGRNHREIAFEEQLKSALQKVLKDNLRSNATPDFKKTKNTARAILHDAETRGRRDILFFIKILGQGLRSLPNHPTLLNPLGKVALEKLRDYHLAQKFFSRCHELYPRNTHALLYLGKCKIELGEIEEGVRLINEAYQIDRNDLAVIKITTEARERLKSLALYEEGSDLLRIHQ